MNLSQNHVEFLRKRAVADDVAAVRGYRTARKKAELAALGFGPSQLLVPALVIPVYSVRGEVESYVLRPDTPRTNKRGKVCKYEMKAGDRMVVDAHPFLTRSPDGNPPLIGDPNVPLFITEGPAKADAALSVGICCAALIGVWNWRGSNEAGGKTALTDWESVALNGRRVYLAFDSDAMEKREVHAALARLKAFLESRKADIRIIYLPPGDHGEKVGLDDFIAAKRAAGADHAEIRASILALASESLRPLPRAEAEGELRVGEYVEMRGELFRAKTLPNGQEVLMPLTNFGARIVADIERDDGAEKSRHFEIEVRRGARTATVSVPVAQFPIMRWPVEALGCDAVVHAGAGAADHARCAIQLLSHNFQRRTVFVHTGWRQVNDQWIFLHGGGAIGANGPVDGVEVQLPPELEPLRLEVADDPAEALRASLRLLDLGPDRITVPLLGAVIRSVLGGADFTVFLYGRTGIFKTELAALAQAHFGSGFDARHLPANFTSTANSNEGLAFLAKDAILAVDEFAPPASGSERDVMHRDAARLLRSQGNRAGRARMRSDGTLRPAKPSRALPLATGEELPRGQSARARMFVIEVPAGAIDPAKLTECQRDATDGQYARALACFVRWLAPRLDDVREEFERLRREARAAVTHGHARTSDIRSQLLAAYSIFVAFLADSGFESEASVLPARVGAALKEAAEAQLEYVQALEPVSAFFALLSSAIAAGAAHVADSCGYAPAGLESACGWRRSALNSDAWFPQGTRVGWLAGEEIFLDRNAAYRAAREMATDGTGVEVSCQTLGSRLKERGLLLTTDPKRETNSIRRKLDGAERTVWHVHPQVLGLLPAEDLTNPTSRSSNVGSNVGSHVGKNGGRGETRQ
jgi:hypothetical protein